MMVATMTLEIAATEFVDASATRFAYRGLGPAMVNAPRSRDVLRRAVKAPSSNISSIFALIPEFTLGIYARRNHR